MALIVTSYTLENISQLRIIGVCSMSECVGCRKEHESALCDSCKVMVQAMSKRMGIVIEDGPEVESLRQMIGNPEPQPAKIWRSMIRATSSGIHDNREIWWAWSDRHEMDERQWICDPPPPWNPTDSEIEVFDSHGSGNHDPATLRSASRGGILPDGSYLSWSDGGFSLDGTRIRLPYRSLIAVLRKHKGDLNYDWKRLLKSIDIALRQAESPLIPPYEWHTRRSQRTTMIHPTFELLNPSIPISRTRWAIRARRESAFSREFFEETPWMRRWELEVGTDLGSPEFKETCSNVPTSLFMRKGRLQLRVRRPSGWRRIMIANDPDLWARLVTWALSPPNHGSFRSLLCLQQHIFTDNQGSYVSDEDARGLEFLRQIVEGHQHASANPELGSFRVRGTSGLSYFVTPGRGPHGSRFTVNPIESYDPEAIPQMRRHHFARLNREGLCIVETPEMRKLVIGDAIGGIILALLDDLGSRHNIDTLDRHLRMRHDDPRVRLRRIADPLAGPAPDMLARRLEIMAREERYHRVQLENNDVAERTRRCTESFPRLWSALLRLPLGERMTFTAMRVGGEPNITFDDCDTEFATMSQSDRNVIYMMMEASGWQRDLEEENLRGTRRIYIRIGLGQRDLENDVLEFCGLLEERLQINQNDEQEPIRLIQNPLRDHFETANPGIADLLPESRGRIR